MMTTQDKTKTRKVAADMLREAGDELAAELVSRLQGWHTDGKDLDSILIEWGEGAAARAYWNEIRQDCAECILSYIREGNDRDDEDAFREYAEDWIRTSADNAVIYYSDQRRIMRWTSNEDAHEEWGLDNPTDILRAYAAYEADMHEVMYRMPWPEIDGE